MTVNGFVEYRELSVCATDPSNSDNLNDSDGGVWVCGCVGVWVCARVRAGVCACVRACVRACVLC